MIKHTQIAKHILNSDINVYKKYGDVLKAKGLLVFQDNGSDVLAVAHLDYVQWHKPIVNSSCISQCPQLDDRLGVATILEWLPTVGKFDVLLCDDEEIGQSTAQEFKPQKQYRYMVEFDRTGSDCVFYQYSREDLEYNFSEAGWEIGFGSFSDIAFLSHLGCQGVNMGIGYHKAHTKQCYANMSEVNSQLAKFRIWYSYYGDQSYPYDNSYDLEPINDLDQELFDGYLGYKYGGGSTGKKKKYDPLDQYNSLYYYSNHRNLS